MTSAARRTDPAVPRMGYQPGLDGLRALSVVLVILYHAGVVRNAESPVGTSHSWFFDGGFLGVEVFFVVSGFLITSLMLEERAANGRVVLHKFWYRRFRRLLPALWVMIAACGVWATLWGHDYLADLKADSFFGLFYGANFQQLAGKVSYFGGFPHLLRHLWSLAVEEHFYLLFPPVSPLVLRRRFTSPRRLLRVVVPAAAASAILLVLVWARPVERLTGSGATLDDTRQNWAYLSSFTRMAGILIGVSLAVVWSPWKRVAADPDADADADAAAAADAAADPAGVDQPAADPAGAGLRSGRRLDLAGLAAVLLVVAAAALGMKSESAALYRGGLTAVSLLSAVAIAAVVDPRARLMRVLFANKVMAAVGRRSYGLYLWHWPIFVGPMNGRPLWERLVVGGAATLVASELCYRFVETPIRRGALGRWFRSLNHSWADGRRRLRYGLPTVACVAGFGLLAGSLVVRLSTVDRGDLAAGGAGASAAGPAEEFDQEAVLAELGTTGATQTTLVSAPSPTTPSGDLLLSATSFSEILAPPPIPVAAGLPPLPRAVVIVGDSTGDSLFHNLPDGMTATFAASNGSLQGCGIYDEGTLVTAYPDWSTKFKRCLGWQRQWGNSVRQSYAEVALVVLGAWDVFDLQLDSGKLVFGTPEWDRYWLSRLVSGITALKQAGATVTLLEIPCMRPQDVKGQGVPPLPERADDTRRAHVNQLMVRAALADPEHVFYVPGPVQFCEDEAIARDLFYRWDGVHASRKGGKLIMEAIAPELLSVPSGTGQAPPTESAGTA